MSLNKYMHPRNQYKTKLDFRSLATENEEFAKYCKIDLSGKIRYDFSNKDAVICMSTLTLKLHFNLDVRIPKETLTPSIPVRLNYILWIEDIFTKLNVETKLFGIDIGCGAACIFPLLIARMYKWNMLGTEINEESVSVANQNVNRNNLQHLVKVQKVPSSCYLADAVENQVNYDFCMCNPPFYCSETDMDMQSKSRSKERKPHTNCQTGLKEEVITEGGEVQFVKNIIKDSVSLNDRIKVYTVMLGHKKSVHLVLKELKKANVQSIGQAQFCQGNTMRWGVAWSFCVPSIYSFLPIDDENKHKKLMEMNFASKYNGADVCFEMIDNHIKKLQFEFTLINRDDDTYALTLTAYENTWINQRRKRREVSRLQKEMEPNSKTDESVNNKAEEKSRRGDQSESFSEQLESQDTVNIANQGCNRKRHYSEIDNNGKSNKRFKSEQRENSINQQSPSSSLSHDPLLKIDLFVIFHNEDNHMTIQAKTLHGEKVLTGQVLQYFKNNFSVNCKE